MRLLVLLVVMAGASAGAAPVRVLAAEAVYGDIATQIGGEAASVTSVLTDPGQDPHAFEPDAAVTRAVSGASIIIVNGLGYDLWTKAPLRAAAGGRRVIDVSEAAGRREGDNPHIWFDLTSMRLAARVMAQELTNADPARRDAFARNLARFESSLDPLGARIAAMRTRTAGVAVAATEPVAGFLLAQLDLDVRATPFARAVMRHTMPDPADASALEADLRTRAVRLLVVDPQVKNPSAARMEAVARGAGVPVVAVAETLPTGKTYQAWMGGVLDALDAGISR